MNQACRDRALAAKLEGAGDRGRQIGHDAREDDQRGAVADAARGDLLAQPHQEHGAAGERDHGRDEEERTRSLNDGAGALQADRDAPGLEHGQHHREIAGVLVQDLAARLAFLLERLERGQNGGEKLNDDRCRDVRHDVQGEDRHALHGAAREHVEKAEHTAAGALEALPESFRVDAGERDVGAETVDDERAQGEPDALLQLIGLGDGAEIDVCRKLLGC